MTHNITESSVTVHKLPKELLDQPLSNRFESALQYWMDLYPASTILRFGQEHDSDNYFFAENMYGPRLHVMTREEHWSDDSKMVSGIHDNQILDRDAIAKNLGVQLRDVLASDPSVELFYSPRTDLQYEFRHELVEALNYGLAQIGSRTHKVALSDHTPEYNKLYSKYWSENDDRSEEENEKIYNKMKALRDPNATLVWQKKDVFAPAQPDPAAIAALAAYFSEYPGHPVVTHVKLGMTIDVQPLDANKWTPMEQTEVERIQMKAKDDLSNPGHQWLAERGTKTDGEPEDNKYYAYLASLQPVPIVRNGHLLYEGMRFDTATDQNVGYVVIGKESCGTSGIDRDVNELLQTASSGKLSQVQMMFSKLPDVIVSAAYHAQVVAHQKERAAWLQKHPVQYSPATGAIITKPVYALQVGDHVGITSSSDGKPDLWCKVTKREGDVVTLFIENGHWDFQLDTSTNQSLPHDIVKDFAGKAQVVYTAPIPVKDGALYNRALEYMREHAERAASLELATAP